MRIVNNVLKEAMRSSNRIFRRIEMEIFLDDALNTALVDCDLEREASRHVDIRDKISALDALFSVVAVAVSLRALRHWVPERNLLHMTTLADDFCSYAETLENFQCTRLQPVCLTSL